MNPAAEPSGPASDVRVLLDSILRYEPDPVNGGFLRHNQLYELVVDACPDAAYTDGDTKSKGRGWATLMAAGRLLGSVRTRPRDLVNARFLKNLGYAGKVWRCLDRSLAEHPAARCIVNDSVFRWPVAEFARQRGLSWVAAPQNLEVLWYGRDMFLDRDYWSGVQFELEWFQSAAAVFCISAEEQFVLANLGVNATLLPFYPPRALAGWLGGVRTARAAASGGRDFLLVLGSANYPPSRDGMTHLLDELLAPGGPRVVVAGAGTEALGVSDRAGVDRLGVVTRDRLFELLRDARALIVHQRYGGGALTRIPEALAAGVPVLASPFAARSARHYPGVHVFNDADELRDLSTADLPTPPSPARPAAEERLFADTLRRLAGTGAGQPIPVPASGRRW